MAAALAAERRHQSADHGGSPLVAVRYHHEALQLWRWVPAPQDVPVRDLIVVYVGCDDDQRTRLRASLTMGDLYTLLEFARRQALLALRTGDQQLVAMAFDALSLIELQRIDWRDLHVTAAVVGAAANHLGLSPADLAGQAARYAEPAVADALMALDVDGFDRCGYLPPATAKLGTVLVTNEFRPYAPKVDLVGAGIEFAEALERDRYRADDLTAGTAIADVWLGADPDARAAAGRLSGCVSVRARPHDATTATPHPMKQPFLLAYLGEAATSDDADMISAAAQSRNQPGAALLGVSAGRNVAVLVARSVVIDVPAPETRESLGRFRGTLTKILSA